MPTTLRAKTTDTETGPDVIALDPPRLVSAQPLLQAQGLTKRYGRITAVEDVAVEAYPGEVLGIVGESGSGKSVTGLTVLRLLMRTPSRIEGGEIDPAIAVHGCDEGNNTACNHNTGVTAGVREHEHR